MEPAQTTTMVTPPTVAPTAATKAQQLFAAMRTWSHWEEIGLCCQKEYGLPLVEYTRRLPEYQKFMALCMAMTTSG